MRLTLLESDRSFFRSAESAVVSIVAHVGVVLLALAPMTGSFRLPTNERDARVLFLLPPDRVDAPQRQAEIRLPGRPGSGLDEAGQLPAEGRDQPFGPAPFLSAKVYTALQVDQMVERYESSAAPVYPPELSARGPEGQVEAAYVVDTTGRVDTTTI
jgi:hypothetical protein